MGVGFSRAGIFPLATVPVTHMGHLTRDFPYWQYNQAKGPFSNTVQIGGNTMNKSWAIAQQFQYVTSASLTDRLRRIAQESRFKDLNCLDR